MASWKANLASVVSIVLPTKSSGKGKTVTGTYDPGATGRALSKPTYQDHLTDIFSSRASDDSNALLQALFNHDPDISAAVNAYLTVANTPPIVIVRDQNGEIDREAIKTVHQLIDAMTDRWDYSQKFQLKPGMSAISEMMRYAVLLRGALGAELVVDKMMLPSEIRLVDMKSIVWTEKTPGQYKPQQVVSGQNENTNLDIPSFFVSFFRRDPGRIYTYSPFVSAINTVAARQQVINDLYRIMQITGFPRVELKVVEEVLLKSAPANVRKDANELSQWISTQMQSIANTFGSLRADQVYAHTDAVEPKIMNDRKAGVELNIREVIDVLNSQNQAALKVMATIIGRGEKGANTASVEARIFAMNADELNEPVAEMWSNLLTFALRLTGNPGKVVVNFAKAELRPETELEPQLTLKQSRLLEQLSLGLITDDEYHLWMNRRVRPDSAPELSGTGFQNVGANAGASADSAVSQTSQAGGSIDRAAKPKGSSAAKSSGVSSSGKTKPKGNLQLADE